MRDIYPGLSVTKDVVTTSICVKDRRVPLWLLVGRVGREGWDSVAEDYGIKSFSSDELHAFLHHLLECRGEFARLLCILADVEREEDEAEDEDWAWWQTGRKDRVVAQLRRCISALEEYGDPWGSRGQKVDVSAPSGPETPAN